MAEYSIGIYRTERNIIRRAWEDFTSCFASWSSWLTFWPLSLSSSNDQITLFRTELSKTTSRIKTLDSERNKDLPWPQVFTAQALIKKLNLNMVNLNSLWSSGMILMKLPNSKSSKRNRAMNLLFKLRMVSQIMVFIR